MTDPTTSIRIATPCQSTWERMAGDERVRHCTLCDLNVYNFAEMTRSEIGELLMKSEGRVCARLYRRADGTLLTKDCPRGIKALRRRMSRFASAVFAALLALSSFATGCATSRKNRSTVTLEVRDAASAQQPAFVGVVTDESGLPLPGVTVVVRDHRTARETTVVTDTNGAFAITGLSDGTYRLAVTLAGLDPLLQEQVVLQRNQITRAQVTLRFTAIETFTVGGIAPMDTDPGSTTFTQEFINNLPIEH